MIKFVLLSSLQSHCENLPSSSDECRLGVCGCRPSNKANKVIIHVHHCHLFFPKSKANTHLTDDGGLSQVNDVMWWSVVDALYSDWVTYVACLTTRVTASSRWQSVARLVTLSLQVIKVCFSPRIRWHICSFWAVACCCFVYSTHTHSDLVNWLLDIGQVPQNRTFLSED